ncbi:hypothetical protein TruAng_001327 [Truncatella angustata]|nr:hypothetical protein TruAng_001327 [Truncatella angustata]
MYTQISTEPAGNRVFGITELLEAILIEVDMRTLLVSAQQVTKWWRCVILQSNRLQKKLFFSGDNSSRNKLNPLLKGAFDFCFFNPKWVEDEPGSDAFWLATSCGAICQPVRWLAGDDVSRFMTDLEAFGRPQASWRNMLVHQPPIPALQQIFTHQSHRHFCGQEIRVDVLAKGLRMSRLVNAIFARNSEKGGCLDHPEERPAAVRIIWHRTPSEIHGVRQLKGIVDSREMAAGVVVQHLIDRALGRAQAQASKRAHKQVSVPHMCINGIEHAQKEQAERSGQAHEQRSEAGSLSPLRVVREPVEPRTVAHVMHGEHGTDEGDARDGAARHKDRLEGEGGNIADEGHVRVHLSWVARLAKRQPPDQQDAQGYEPSTAGDQREYPEVTCCANVAEETRPSEYHDKSDSPELKKNGSRGAMYDKTSIGTSVLRDEVATSCTILRHLAGGFSGPT